MSQHRDTTSPRAMLTLVEQSVLRTLQASPGPGRHKWRGGWKPSELGANWSGVDMRVLLSTLHDRQYVRAIHVDGYDPEDLEMWRFYITSEGVKALGMEAA